MDLLGLMLGGQANYQRSLTEMCQDLLEQDVVMGKQALDERLNEKAGRFFKQLLEEVLKLKLIEHNVPSIFKSFPRIKVTDATTFQLPNNLSDSYKGFGGGATDAGIKTHYQVDILTGQHMAVEVVDAASSDTSADLMIADKGSLQLFDLGYYSLPVLEEIDNAGSFYLCRLKYNTLVWIRTEDGFARLDWSEQINKMQEGQLQELQVYLGADRKVQCRMIIEKVPDKIAGEKRRKLKTDKVNKRKSLSKGRLHFCALNVFITNATGEQIAKEHARELYRLRWQIEIYFKTWKSYMNIDKIERMNVDRFNCTHYGSLVFIVLTSKLFFFFKHKYWKAYQVELSELKAFKMIAKRKQMIWNILFGTLKTAHSDLTRLADNLLANCIKERKANKLRPYESMSYVLT